MTLVQKISLGLFLIVMAIYGLYEVYGELLEVKQDGGTFSHAAVEIFVVVIIFIAMIYFTKIMISQYKKQTKLEENLTLIRKQLESSNIRLREGKKEYHKVIEWQFKEWGLSPGEQEIALLMLKGASIKEISQSRSTHEKTVRKQASSIYEKSSLGGRHELSAWFFEDLL